jgi:hypothetical protein
MTTHPLVPCRSNETRRPCCQPIFRLACTSKITFAASDRVRFVKFTLGQTQACVLEDWRSGCSVIKLLDYPDVSHFFPTSFSLPLRCDSRGSW